MKFSSILLLLTGLFAFSFNSNVAYNSADCNTYFPLTKGMEWTMKNMDKKGKETSRSTIKVLDTKPAEGGIIYVMQGLLEVDGKKDEVRETNFEYQCDGNILKFNMDQFLTEDMKKNEAVTFEVDTDGMELPSTLAEGQKLKDASVKIVGSMNGMKMMTMTVVVSDRIVEKFEDVTTAAGTYECAKITSKTHVKFGFMDSNTSSNQWISKAVGIVKSEEFDKKGKLESTSELVEFVK